MATIYEPEFNLTYSPNFALEGIEEANIDLNLDVLENDSSSVYGVVTIDGEPVPNATVKLFDRDGNPFKHTLTDSEGEYTLDGVPSGTYTISAVKSGCVLSPGKGITLMPKDTTQVNLTLERENTLDFGAIAGILMVAEPDGTKTPLGNAKITLKNADSVTVESTYTIDDGEFAFYDLADGFYTLISSSDGYLPETMSVKIANGSIINVIMNVGRDTRTYNGTVSGIIRDSSGSPLSGCFVGLYKIFIDDNNTRRETLVAFTKTNNSGKYMFGEVVGGSYLVKAKKTSDLAKIDVIDVMKTTEQIEEA